MFLVTDKPHASKILDIVFFVAQPKWKPRIFGTKKLSAKGEQKFFARRGHVMSRENHKNVIALDTCQETQESTKMQKRIPLCY